MGEIFKATKEQKEEAKKRLNGRERERGDIQEYNEELIETHKRFADTRKRANQS